LRAQNFAAPQNPETLKVVGVPSAGNACGSDMMKVPSMPVGLL
jgi:hypothetical protein